MNAVHSSTRWHMVRKYVFCLVMALALAGISTGARAYMSLFSDSSGFKVTDRSGLDASLRDQIYHGYSGQDFTGYYIGTIDGNTDGNTPLQKVIEYYLGENLDSFSALKVDYDDDYPLGLSDETGDLFVTWEGDLKSGTWTLSSSLGFGFYAVKGGSEFALYFVDPAQSSGNWTTRHLEVGEGKGKKDNSPINPEISHLSGVPTQLPVPEPGTLILFGIGLLGLCVMARRRNS